MNKKIFVILLMLILSGSANAQLIKAAFGVTGGGVATQMMTDLTLNKPMYISGYGGAFATINYGSSIGLRGGVNYSMQGAELSLSGVPVQLKQSYLNVPVAFMYHIKSFISVQAGFYQNILLTSSLTEKGSDPYTLSPDPGALKYNFGASAGIAVNIGRLVFIDIKYNLGLSKSYASMGVGYPTNTITVGVGFNIISTRQTIF